ncbi:MAG TPA: cytochrome c biogenesis heme-transporting ATPase CcmA [Rubrivivax sp.]
MGAATPLLQVRALSGHRGERSLFAGLDFSLAAGELIWLRGRNGRGKTTLLRLLAGLSTPTAGEIAVDGVPLRQARTAWRTQMAYVGHANALKDDLSAAEALRFVAQLRGEAPPAGAIDQALQRLGVESRRRAPVRTLSQGQRRRVALARLALPAPPRLWLLDEPFDALDDDGVEALNTLLAEHAARGGAVLLTSHLPLSLHNPVPRVLDLDRFAPA